MKLRILLLLALFGYTLGQTTSTTPPTTPTTPPTTPTTTQSSQSTPTTQLTSTTTPAPTTTTPAPTTTTPAPTTTTPAPTTTTPAPTTTTPAPTTTTPPDLLAFQWGLKDNSDDKKFCVLLTAGIQFSVFYKKLDKSWATAVITVPQDANVSSAYNCSDGETVTNQLFGLLWDTYTLTLEFNKTSDTEYLLNTVKLDFSYAAKEFSDAAESGSSGSSKNESIGISTKTDSYKCMFDHIFDMTVRDDNKTDTGNLSKLQFLAFNTVDALDDFGNPTECPEDFTTSDIVPIAVGCALAALVVIVLIAYLIGRKRSRQKGYQSV